MYKCHALFPQQMPSSETSSSSTSPDRSHQGPVRMSLADSWRRPLGPPSCQGQAVHQLLAAAGGTCLFPLPFMTQVSISSCLSSVVGVWQVDWIKLEDLQNSSLGNWHLGKRWENVWICWAPRWTAISLVSAGAQFGKCGASRDGYSIGSVVRGLTWILPPNALEDDIKKKYSISQAWFLLLQNRKWVTPLRIVVKIKWDGTEAVLSTRQSAGLGAYCWLIVILLEWRFGRQKQSFITFLRSLGLARGQLLGEGWEHMSDILPPKSVSVCLRLWALPADLC